MSLERSKSEASLTDALLQLQLRLSAATPALNMSPQGLYGELHALLLRAVRDEVLQNGMYALKKLLRLTPDPKGTPRCWVLTGGPLDFGRTKQPGLDTHFVRADGAVVHFHMVLRERDSRSTEILAYGFEIYFPSGAPIAFVRFDLNGRGHSNEGSGLRSHLHPGHDDFQLPSPVLAPHEALLLVLHGCRLRRESARS